MGEILRKLWSPLVRVRLSAQRGAVFLQFAIILPMAALVVGALSEPLIVAWNTNRVHHLLSEVAEVARQDSALQKDYWTSVQTNSADYDKFRHGRQKLADALKAALNGSSIQLLPVHHLDKTPNGTREEVLDIAYLPPGSSAYIPELDNAPVNNSHRCLTDVAVFKGLRRESSPPPHKEILGVQIGCPTARQIDPGNIDHSLTSLGEKFPTEVTAVVRIRGLLGTHRLAVSVPFYPRLKGPALKCSPSWSNTINSAWQPPDPRDPSNAAKGCGPSTRIESFTDGCDNSQTKGAQFCFSGCAWTPTSPTQWSDWTTTCGPGERYKLEEDGCGFMRNCTAGNCVESRCIPDCCWTRNYEGSWSTSCGIATRQYNEKDKCNNIRPSSGYYSESTCFGNCNWQRSWTGTCSVNCGGGTRGYSDKDACGISRPGIESCNPQPCPCYYRVNWTLGRYQADTVCGTNDEGCVSGTLTNFCGYNTSFSWQTRGGSGGGNDVAQQYYDRNSGSLPPIFDLFTGASTGTYYVNDTCSSTISSTIDRTLCGTMTVAEYWDSPISLVTKPNSELEATIARFRMNPTLSNPQEVQWFGSEDLPLLVWDPTHQGTIEDGSQLFGSYSFGQKWRNGYEALASLDKDGDGKLSGSELEPLAIWADKNRDAQSQRGEVVTISEFGLEEVFVTPDNIQKDTHRGFIWATRGFTRYTNGKREILPTVDWFTPSGVSATLPIGSADVKAKLSEGSEEATSLSVSAGGKEGSEGLSDSDKDAYSVWRWAVGEDTKAPANEGGWLFVKTLKEGNIEVKSVVVAPVEKNESGVGHLAFVTVLTGTENVGRMKERLVNFAGKRPDQKDPASGISITSRGTIAPDGLTMSGETTQEPFGGSTARKVTYPWRAFLVRRATKPKGV
jgi:hypothetical protein